MHIALVRLECQIICAVSIYIKSNKISVTMEDKACIRLMVYNGAFLSV